jgi:hypothetical protein
MIDTTTKNPIRVLDGGLAGPYLMVPVDQLDRIRALLDQHGIRYWVESEAISINNGPATVIVNFGFTGDAARLQRIFDEAE